MVHSYLYFCLVYNLNSKVPLGSFCSKNDLHTSIEKIKANIVRKATDNKENDITLAPLITFDFVSLAPVLMIIQSSIIGAMLADSVLEKAKTCKLGNKNIARVK